MHFVNAVNANSMGGKRFNKQKKTYYCTFCNFTGHTIDRCYKKHGFPPNYKNKGKHTVVYNNPSAYPLKNAASFAANLSSLHQNDCFVMPYQHRPSIQGVNSGDVNLSMEASGVANGLSNEQFQKLTFLLNNTQSNVVSADYSGTRTGRGVVKPIVSQAIAY